MNTKKFHHIVPEIHIGKHHEDYPAIEKMFFTVVNNFLNCFQDICNSFKEDEPIVLDTDEVSDSRNSVMFWQFIRNE